MISTAWIKTVFTKRMLIIFLMGFYSGLPLALTGSTLQGWFASENINLVTIGFITLIGQPYAYKFLWAPIFDKIRVPILGRRTGWILITQLLLVGLIALMACFDIQSQVSWIAGCGILIAFCSASQDIVFDAYKIDILQPQERGLGIAMGVEGYRVAMFISGGGSFILADYYGWKTTYLIMSGLMAMGLIITAYAGYSQPARAQEDFELTHSTNSPINSNSWFKLFYDPLADFFKRPGAKYALLFIILFKLGDVYTLALSSTFLLKSVQLSLTEIGLLNKTMGPIASLIGIFVGGLLLSRINLFKILFFFAILQCVSSLAYVLLAVCDKNLYLAMNAIFIEYLCAGMGNAALCVFIMSLCNKKFSALQYALLTSIAAFGRIFVGPSAGLLAHSFDWTIYFIVASVLSLPCLLLLPKLSRLDQTNPTFLPEPAQSPTF